MALTSPGVQVSVIDESFYTPAEPGTVPMVFVASASNKKNAAGTGTAKGTLKATAGKPYLLTSQRDLADTFGDPTFQVDASNNPIHAGELNEYGLQAAYSLLGVSNRAWVVRADIDLNELTPTSSAPSANPLAGTYWFDTTNSKYGIQQWNAAPVTTTGGQTFATKTPIVIDTTDGVVDYAGANYAPLASTGAIGDYAVVAVTTLNRTWYKNALGTWVEVGTDAWTASWPTIKATVANPDLGSPADITINGTAVSVGSNTITDVASSITGFLASVGITAAAVDGFLEIYSNGSSSGADDSVAGGPIIIGGDTTKLQLLGIAAGTYYPPAVQVSAHTSVPEFKIGDSVSRPTGSIWIKTTAPNGGANLKTKLWNAETLLWDEKATLMYSNNVAALYGLDVTGGGANLAVGQLFAKTNVANDAQPLGTFTIYRRQNIGATSIKSAVVTAVSVGSDTKSVTISASNKGSAVMSAGVAVSITTTGSASADAVAIAAGITSAGVANVSATVDAQNKVVVSHSQGGDIKFVDTDGLLSAIGFTPFVATNPATTPNLSYEDGTSVATSPKQFVASNWRVLTYTAKSTAPSSLATDGQLWYNSIVDEVDMMYHNGTTWVGYNDATAFSDADSNGPIVAASMPTVQSDGSALVTGDIWVSTADLENYPTVYRYNNNIAGTTAQKWGNPLDTGDQTTEDGILFADARWSTSGGTTTGITDATIAELRVSNFLDADAPDPALYPKGMLLWNLRRSGFNVKRFERNYVDTSADNLRMGDSGVAPQSGYYPHRWVTDSGNQADGTGSFGRKAQRKVVVQALQAVVNNNDEIRDDESKLFNVMATPGYPELIGEMISLNFDRGLTAFILGDSPMRLTPDATSLNEWGTNVNLAVEDNDDGLVSRDEYLGVFYPAGFSSDNAGNNVVVPASHMMLRTIALSDQVSYPWFAPAGTRRGGITNASSTGYISNEGEFVSVSLNEGQRDTLYSNNINPITFISGAGLVNFGQKTRARGASALDRINVARLVIYLRSQLNTLAKPYIFEPNDTITRNEIKQAAESLLLELVGQRGLYDYLVVCDETNNTPSRIDRNELYLDIAIEPVKAVEFIYIPLRLKNTGEISGL
tara:strand:- start:4401 stop:7724 length:3324 start_codon:yes stop_codon:yes gene_type:complete